MVCSRGSVGLIWPRRDFTGCRRHGMTRQSQPKPTTFYISYQLSPFISITIDFQPWLMSDESFNLWLVSVHCWLIQVILSFAIYHPVESSAHQKTRNTQWGNFYWVSTFASIIQISCFRQHLILNDISEMLPQLPCTSRKSYLWKWTWSSEV